MKSILSLRLIPEHRLVFTSLTIIALTISAAGARAWLTAPPAGPTGPNLQGGVTDDAGRPRVESEVITLSPTGFNPAEITRPRGRFLILVDNRSELDEVTFRLSRADGHGLREVRRTKEELIWKQLEDLPPGEYLLTEASNPEWVCRITITSL